VSAWSKHTGRVLHEVLVPRRPAGLDRHRVEVLRLLDDLRVPFDNNQAERDLRTVKSQQELSGCWRTLDGAAAFLTVRSYVSTARKHGVDPLHALRQSFQQGSPWLAAQQGPEQLSCYMPRILMAHPR
jgi:hypothetical protein